MAETVNADASTQWTKESARLTVKQWLNDVVRPSFLNFHWLQQETDLDFSKLYNWFSYEFRKTPPPSALDAIAEAVEAAPPPDVVNATCFLFPHDGHPNTGALTAEICTRPLASYEEVGQWITYVRKQRNLGKLTQSELAARIGCNTVTVHKWESSKSQLNPTQEELDLIAQICGFPPPVIDPTYVAESGLDPMAAEIVNRPLENIDDLAQWIVHVRKHCRSGKLTQRQLADRIERSVMTVHKWEKPGSPISPKYDDLQRIAETCGFPVPEIDFELRPSRDGRPQIYMPPLASTLREEIEHTAKALALRCFKTSMAERNATMFSHRFGCNGPENATLQTIGDAFGVTRERVRMVEERLLQFLPTTTVRSEMFDALAQAAEALPTTVLSDAEDRLRHLLGESLSLEGAIEYGIVVLGRRLPVEITKRSGMEPLVTAGALPSWYGLALNQCKSIIRHNGAALPTVAWAMTMRTTGEWVPYEDFVAVLQRFPGFQCLGENEWFWLGPDGSANRVVERAASILQNSPGALDIEAIYGGLVRPSRNERSSVAEQCASWPPMSVVGQVLTEHPAFACKQSNDFSLREPQNPDEVDEPGAAEAIVAFLNDHDGIASRWEINDYMAKEGTFQPVTVAVALSSSPMIAQVDRGVFAIRGRALDPARLEEAQAAVGGPQSLSMAVQITETGVVWENVLTEGAMRNRAASVPARAKESLPEGRYRLGDDRYLTVIENRVGGLVAYLAGQGAQAGWRYRVDFEVPHARVSVAMWPPAEEGAIATTAE